MVSESPTCCEPGQVKAAWVELLSRMQWNLFVSLTVSPRVRNVWGEPERFDYPGRKFYRGVGQESLSKAWKAWLYKVLELQAITDGLAEIVERDGKRRVCGPWVNAWRKGKGLPVWVLGLERARPGARLHGHALLKLPDRIPWVDYRMARERWNQPNGFIRIEQPRDQRHVRAYVSKYVVKGGDLELSDSFVAPRMSVADVASRRVAECHVVDTPV